MRILIEGHQYQATEEILKVVSELGPTIGVKGCVSVGYVGYYYNANINDCVLTIETETKNKYGTFENVLLTLNEYERLKSKFPYAYDKHIDNLSCYIESKGDKYKSHYATILAWTRKEEKESGTLSSFDTEDFFQAALARSAKHIRERAKSKENNQNKDTG